MKPISIEEATNRIKQKFPNQPFEIISFANASRSKFTIKCLTCGEIKTYSTFNNFLSSGQAICQCLGRSKTLKRKQERFEEVLALIKENLDQEFVEWNYREYSRHWAVKVLCKKCGQIFEKTVSNYLINQQCHFCENHHNLNTAAFKLLLPPEYELLEEYKGMDTKVLFRHKCGFIRRISPHALLSGHAGCPRCSDKMSHGEKKVVDYLHSKGLDFKKEATFSWQTHKRYRYDFYVPAYNLIIEYHGEQHFKSIKRYDEKLSFELRQQRDQEKRKEAEENGYNYLMIPYTSFRKIEDILENWFNDYPKME